MKHPILRRIPGARQWIEKIERLEGERDRLVRRLAKLNARLESLPEIAPQLARSEYKAVWRELSKTSNSAKWHIGGVDEESWFEVTGLETKEALASTVGIHQNDTVVEIGCGVGRVGKQLAPLCRKWVGCDVSAHMLKLAAQRLKGLGDVELREISGFDLQPLANDSADVVYSTVVFMHLEEWDRYNYVLEAFRVLRPGGRIYVDNVNLCSDLGWEVFEMHRQIPSRERPLHITKHSTKGELETYLERAGFSEIQSRESGQFIQVWGMKRIASSA
ncbi:MAG: class I SAM-dependent methyltransferase [Chthoniobacterales bacterium]|nr:class I SAM-dependent methyltransferase [Chthoniobacterales bacterium]